MRYTGAKSSGQSAARLANYVGHRRAGRDGREAHEEAKTFGDRAGFVEAAKERAKEGRRSSYVHVVVSPERGAEYSDEDFARLLPDLVRDRRGRDAPHFAAVHRDGNRPHMHVAVARDKYQKDELEKLKERVNERIAERDRLRDGPVRPPRSREGERGGERGPWRERSGPPPARGPVEAEARTPGHAPGSGRDGSRARRDGVDQTQEPGRTGTWRREPSEERVSLKGEARRAFDKAALDVGHGLKELKRQVDGEFGRTPDVRVEPVSFWKVMFNSHSTVQRLRAENKRAAVAEQERIWQMERGFEKLQRRQLDRYNDELRDRERAARAADRARDREPAGRDGGRSARDGGRAAADLGRDR